MKWVLLVCCCFLATAVAQRPSRILLVAANAANQIYSMNLDGTGTPKVYITQGITTGTGPTGIAPDTINQKLYMAGGQSNKVDVSNINPFGGTNGVDVTPVLAGQKLDVDVDPRTSIVYYSTNAVPQLVSVKGGSATPLVSSAGLIIPGISLDPQINTIYYCEQKNLQMRSIKTDGSSDTLLYNSVLSGGRVTGCRNVFHTTKGILIWSQHSQGLSPVIPPANDLPPGIMKGKTDGTGTPQLLFKSENNFLPYGVWVDGDLVYWTEFTKQGVTPASSAVWVGSIYGIWKRKLFDLPTIVNARGIVIPSTTIPNKLTVSGEYNIRQKVDSAELQKYLDMQFRYLGFSRPQ